MMTKTANWKNPEETVLNQRRPQQIVEQHVLANVTGLISSLQRNLDIKRDADGLVDAISAEDIGKFPDVDLAA